MSKLKITYDKQSRVAYEEEKKCKNIWMDRKFFFF